MSYKSLCVVITDWGDLRDQIFSRTGFAPSGGVCVLQLSTRVPPSSFSTGLALSSVEGLRRQGTHG